MNIQMDELNFYIEQLRDPDINENAFHCLLELQGDIVPSLIQRYNKESDITIKSQLIEIIWQRQKNSEVLQFLSKVIKDENPILWKIAIDGFVSIGGIESLEILKKITLKNNINPKKQKWLIEAIGQIDRGK